MEHIHPAAPRQVVLCQALRAEAKTPIWANSESAKPQTPSDESNFSASY